MGVRRPRYILYLIHPDGLRDPFAAADTQEELIARFAEEAPPEMRGRIDDEQECREFWLNPIPRPRKKAPPKPTPIMFPVTAWGETKGILAWERDPRCKVCAQTLKQRLVRTTRVWSPEEAISTPAKKGLKIVEMRIENAMRPEIYGETKTIDEWLHDPRCEANPLWFRELLHRGVPPELALVGVCPPEFQRRAKAITAWGETKSAVDWSKDPRCRVSASALRQAIKRGVPPEKALLGLYRIKTKLKSKDGKP